MRLTSPHATKSRSRRTTTSAQRPEPPHRDPEPAKMSCQTYLTRGERRTRGSNENRNVCFVELSVTACGVVVRLMPPSELARRALYDLHDELTPPIVEALLSIRGAKIMSTHIRQGEHCLRDKCSDLLARRLPSEGSTASSRARRTFGSTVHLLNGVFDVVRKYTHGPVEGEVRTTQIEPTSRVFCDLAALPAGTSSARVRMQLSVRTPSAHLGSLPLDILHGRILAPLSVRTLGQLSSVCRAFLETHVPIATVHHAEDLTREDSIEASWSAFPVEAVHLFEQARSSVSTEFYPPILGNEAIEAMLGRELANAVLAGELDPGSINRFNGYWEPEEGNRWDTFAEKATENRQPVFPLLHRIWSRVRDFTRFMGGTEPPKAYVGTLPSPGMLGETRLECCCRVDHSKLGGDSDGGGSQARPVKMQMGVFLGSRVASMHATRPHGECSLPFSSLGVEVTASKKLSRSYRYKATGSDRTAPEFCVYPIPPFYETAFKPVVIQGPMDVAFNVHTKDDEWLATTQREFNDVAMGVVDHEIYMRRLIASEDAVRWFWFSWTEPPRKRSPTHSVAALWNEFMMEMFKDDMRSYRTEYGL